MEPSESPATHETPEPIVYLVIDCDTDTHEYLDALVAFVSLRHGHNRVKVVHTNADAIASDVADGISDTDARVFHVVASVTELQLRPMSQVVAHVTIETRGVRALIAASVPLVTRGADGTFRFFERRLDSSGIKEVRVPTWGTLNLYEELMRRSPCVARLGCDYPDRMADNGQPLAIGSIVFDGLPVAIMHGTPSAQVHQLIRAWNEGGARDATRVIYPPATGMPLDLALQRYISIQLASIRSKVTEKHIVEKGIQRVIRVRLPSIESNEFAEFQFSTYDDIRYRLGRSAQWKPFGAVDPRCFKVIREILMQHSKRVAHFAARLDTESQGDALSDEVDDLETVIQEKERMRLHLLNQMQELSREIDAHRAQLRSILSE